MSQYFSVRTATMCPGESGYITDSTYRCLQDSNQRPFSIEPPLNEVPPMT